MPVNFNVLRYNSISRNTLDLSWNHMVVGGSGYVVFALSHVGASPSTNAIYQLQLHRRNRTITSDMRTHLSGWAAGQCQPLVSNAQCCRILEQRQTNKFKFFLKTCCQILSIAIKFTASLTDLFFIPIAGDLILPTFIRCLTNSVALEILSRMTSLRMI